jgi:transposase
VAIRFLFKIASLERLEIRAIIKFCQEEGETPSKTYKRILDIKGKASVSRTLVFDWHKRFREGMTEISDKEGRGRKTKITGTLVTSIAATLEKDRRLTVRALSSMFGISYGTVQSILTKDLKMRKVSTLVYFIF